MEQLTINAHLIRRYLLDQLPDKERERLEVGLLTDDQYYETLAALQDEIEDELIDEYLDGELTEAECEKFERVFLNTPERAHKLKVLKDLKHYAAAPIPEPKYISTKAEPLATPGPSFRWNPVIALFQNPIVGLSMATALLVAMLSTAWLLIRSNRLEAQLRDAQTQGQSDSGLKEQVNQLSKNNEELSAQLQRSEEQRASLEQDLASLKNRENRSSIPSFASVVLSSSLRGSSDNRSVPMLSLSRGVSEARLILDVEEVDPKDYKRFRALVKKRSGAEVWRNENVKLRASGTKARTTLTLLAERFTEGEYTVDLDGVTFDDQIEPLGLYHFRAVAK